MIGPYLVDSVTLRMDKGADKWGEPNATTDVATKAYIEFGEHRITNALGQLIISSAKVYMRPRTIIKSGYESRASNTISYKDKLVYDGEEHAIVDIRKGKDFRVRSIEVYVT